MSTPNPDLDSDTIGTQVDPHAIEDADDGR